MYVRFASFEGAPDQVEALLRQSREQWVPNFQQMAGFRRIYGFADRASGRMVSFSLWEPAEAIRASEEQAAALRRQWEQATGARDEPAVRAYDVVHAVEATGDDGGTTDASRQVARLTTAQILPARIDDLERHVREQTAPMMQRQPGFIGAYSCADRPSGHVLSLSLWRCPRRCNRRKGRSIRRASGRARRWGCNPASSARSTRWRCRAEPPSRTGTSARLQSSIYATRITA